MHLKLHIQWLPIYSPASARRTTMQADECTQNLYDAMERAKLQMPLNGPDNLDDVPQSFGVNPPHSSEVS